jgi:3-deoxy-D-manno-octulosonic acid kinase
MKSFTRVARSGKVALVREDWAPVIAGALLEGEGCTPAYEGGRGRLVRFAYAGGAGLIRRYLRGGVIRHFLEDAFLLQNRARRELSLMAFLFDKRLPVPAPLGACWERRGLFFRGAIATRELPAVNLLEYLRGHGDSAESILHDCGQLIRRFHDVNVFHADLQVRNVLINEGGLYLIDFDKAELEGDLTKLQRARNLLRFRRSLEKNGFPVTLFRHLCEGYGVDSLPGWIDRIYHAKGRFSDIASGRVHDHADSAER